MNYVTGSEQTLPISWSPVPSRKNWYPPASGIFFKFDIQTRCGQMEKEIEKKTDLGHTSYI